MPNGTARSATALPDTQTRDRRAEVRLPCVPELLDERMRFERGVHDATLDALAAAMNETNLTMSGRVRLFYVGDDDLLHVARMERVKVDEVFDRKADEIVHGEKYEPTQLNLEPPSEAPGTVQRKRLEPNSGTSAFVRTVPSPTS